MSDANVLSQGENWAAVSSGLLVFCFGWGLSVNVIAFAMDSYTEVCVLCPLYTNRFVDNILEDH
jgi:hypothetical protein